MKLVEKKNKVPSSFVSSHISNAWDQISIISSEIESIKKEFNDTEVIEDCLQAVSDAYLILAGRFQNYLEGKNEIKKQEEIKVTESFELKEDTIRAERKPIVNESIEPQARPAEPFIDYTEFNNKNSQFRDQNYYSNQFVDNSNFSTTDATLSFDEMPAADTFDQGEYAAMMDMLSKQKF